ncbi:MAG: hypothetical protein RIC54_23705 [Thalassobaculum sp.]
MTDLRQMLPVGLGMPSAFRPWAITSADRPATYSAKIRRTMAACSGLTVRRPRIGSPLASSSRTTS